MIRPELDDPGIRDRLGVILVDADASIPARTAALHSLLSFHDPKLADHLTIAIQDANLEGTPFLEECERALSRPISNLLKKAG